MRSLRITHHSSLVTLFHRDGHTHRQWGHFRVGAVYYLAGAYQVIQPGDVASTEAYFVQHDQSARWGGPVLDQACYLVFAHLAVKFVQPVIHVHQIAEVLEKAECL